jgi:serine/threonine-protein kinase RsbW
MGREYEICVSSQFLNLAAIAEFVSERAQLAGLSEDQVFDIQMAVDEACTNAMEHAYDGQPDGQVRVCCYVERDEFVVRVTDYGRSFDPATIAPPDLSVPLEERQIGGLGLFLMKQLMDRVEYRADEKVGNQMVMRKRVR